MVIFQLIQKPQKRGAEVFAAQLSERLKSFGHDVVLISLFEGVADLGFTGETIHLNRPISKRLFDFSGWKKLAQLIAERQPDIIQCNAGDTLKFAVMSKLLFRWESPLIVRNASMVSSYINSKTTQRINAFLYKKVNAVFSVSQLSAADINAVFPETTHKTFVLPIGIEKINISNTEWKIPQLNKTNIVHVGGFTFEKNHTGLLRIWEKFLKIKPDSTLHLFGDGPLRASIENEVKLKNLEESVFFYGWVSNPCDYIAKADLFVLPSIIEGLPGVLLEAMYCRTPVVANNVGGISEILRNEETGFLIAANDEKAFVAAMIKAIESKNESMIENALQQVENNYTNDYIAKEFEKRYLMIKDNFSRARK